VCVGALGVVFCILDCVDGDLARVTGRTSRLGAYADFITDIVYRIALYASIGLIVDRSPIAESLVPIGEGAGLAVGLACVLFAVVARACRLYVEADGSSASPARGTRDTGASVAIAFLSGIDHLLPIGVLAFGAAGRLDWLLAYLFVYSLGDLVLTQGVAWRRLR
jgi:phosphatidylglycerophosphate synthase